MTFVYTGKKNYARRRYQTLQVGEFLLYQIWCASKVRIVIFFLLFVISVSFRIKKYSKDYLLVLQQMSKDYCCS